MYRRLSVVAFIALATCASAPNKAFYTRDLCEPPHAVAPDGQCSANIRVQWSFGGERLNSVQTDVLVFCKTGEFGNGAILTGYRDHAEHGVALRWLSNDHLEVGIPPGQGRRPQEMRWFSDSHIAVDGRNPGKQDADPDATLAKTIQITYRDLTPKDAEWKHGCYLKRPKAKKP